MRLVRMAGDTEVIDRTAVELHDRLVSHLFECGMQLAAVLSRDQVDAEDRRRLLAVIQELDGAIRTARFSVFAEIEVGIEVAAAVAAEPSYVFS